MLEMFAVRLRKMQDTENELLRKQLVLSRACTTYSLSLYKFEEMIRAEKIPSSEITRLQELEGENMELRNSIKIEESAVEELNREFNKLQEDYQLSIESLLNEDFNYNANGERLHAFQQLSNIHINAKKLPDTVQGMVVCGRQQEKSWIPFQLSTNEVDKQQIPEILWYLAQHTDNYNKQWEYLLFGEESMAE